MGLLSRARDALFTRAKKAPSLSSHTIEHSKLDEFICRDLRGDSHTFDGFMAEPLTLDDDTPVEGWEPMKEDVFFGYHAAGNDVRTTPDDRLQPSKAFLKKVMEEFVATEDHRTTRARTKGNALASGMSTVASLGELAKGLKEHEDQLEQTRDLEEKENAVTQAQDQLQDLREEAADAHQAGEEIDQRILDAIPQMVEQRDQAAAELANALEQVDVGQQAAAAQAIAQQAAKAGKEIAKVWSELPGNEPGNRTTVKPDTAFELAKQWQDNPILLDLLRMLGRFKREFRTQRAKRITGGREEPIGVEVGNDLSKVLISQKAKLRHPVMRRSFYKDFTNRQLLQRETRGTELAGRGPVIGLVDLSGSMMNPKVREEDGTNTFTHGRRKWAAATMLAILSGAHRERRDVHVIAYEDKVIDEWSFPGRRDIDIQTVTAFAIEGPRGGTDITKALVRAEKFMAAAPAFKQADIVLITDGADTCHPTDIEIRDRLRAKGVRIHGVQVEAPPSPYLNQVCDDVVSVRDLSQPAEANKHLAHVIT